MNTTVPSANTTAMKLLPATGPNGETNQMATESQEMKYVWVNWFHFLVVGPLLVYIGMKGKSTPQMAFWALTVLAVVVILYHLWILSQKMSHPAMRKEKEGFTSRCPVDSFACA